VSQHPDESRPVVVACDSSWQSHAAVPLAAREAARRGVRLAILVVRDGWVRRVERLGGIARAEEEARQSAQVVAERAQWLARNTDPWVSTQIVLARDAEDPVLRVLGAQAELLVVGSQGSGGLVAFTLGSISAELARRFSCPLLVVGTTRRATPDLGRSPAIVVGLATEGPLEDLLSIAAHEAELRETNVIVVHAAEGKVEADLRPVWAAVASVFDGSRWADVPHRVVISHDQPVAALVEHTEVGDLLVVGTRGGGRLAGLVPGSVCRGVLDAMPCDVLVVPPGHRPEDYQGVPAARVKRA
jgi:nucleotide-binding universal stress UspA family protein